MELKKTHIKKVISLINRMTSGAFSKNQLYLDEDDSTFIIASKHKVFSLMNIENVSDINVREEVTDVSFEPIDGELEDQIDLFLAETDGAKVETNTFRNFANVVKENYQNYPYIAIAYNEKSNSIELLPCNNLTYTEAFLKNESLDVIFFDSMKLHYIFRTFDAINEKDVLFNIPNNRNEPTRFIGDHAIAGLMPIVIKTYATKEM